MATGTPTPRVPITAKTREARACSPPGMPGPAMAAAPPTASNRFLGLAPDRTAARPRAPTGLGSSMGAIHFGMCGWSSPRGRPRNWRAATSRSSTPRAIFTQLTQVAGDPEELAPPAPASGSAIAPTTPRPSSQPSTNMGPLTLARRLVSMSTTAMIGIGLSAIPTASGRDPPMASPMTPPLRGVVSGYHLGRGPLGSVHGHTHRIVNRAVVSGGPPLITDGGDHVADLTDLAGQDELHPSAPQVGGELGEHS